MSDVSIKDAPSFSSSAARSTETPELAGIPALPQVEIARYLTELTDHLTLQQSGSHCLRQASFEALATKKRQLTLWVNYPLGGDNMPANRVPRVSHDCKTVQFWSSAMKRVLQWQLKEEKKDEEKNSSKALSISPFWADSATGEVPTSDSDYPRPNSYPSLFSTFITDREQKAREAAAVKWRALLDRPLRGTLPWRMRLPQRMAALERLELLVTRHITGVATAGALIRHFFSSSSSSDSSSSDSTSSEISRNNSNIHSPPVSVHFCALRVDDSYSLAELFFSLFEAFGERPEPSSSSSPSPFPSFRVLKTLSIFFRIPRFDRYYNHSDVAKNLKIVLEMASARLADVEELLLGGILFNALSLLLGSHSFPALRRLGLVLESEEQITEQALAGYFEKMSAERRQMITHLSVYTYDSLKEYHNGELKKEEERMKQFHEQEKMEKKEVVLSIPSDSIIALMGYIKREFPSVIRFNGQPI